MGVIFGTTEFTSADWSTVNEGLERKCWSRQALEYVNRGVCTREVEEENDRKQPQMHVS